MTLEQEIIEVLKKSEMGLSGVDLAKKVSGSRPTVIKYLEIMRAKGLVDYKNIGMVKLWNIDRTHIVDLMDKEKGEITSRLRTILDFMGDGIAILDKNMKLVWSNKIYEKQELRVKKPSKVKGAECYRILQGILKTGKIERCEVEYEVNEKTYCYDIVGSPIRDYETRVIGIFILRRDITEKKKLEKALEESEERYRTIFENAYVGVCRTTPGKKGRFIDVNPAYLRMFGYESKEDLLKKDVCDVYQDPKDRDRFSEIVSKNGFVEDFLLKQKKKDGTPILIKENVVAVYDENGEVRYFDCIEEDITEKNKLEDALKESEEKYRNIFENVPIAIFRTTPGKEGSIIDANPAYYKMFGYDSKEEFLKVHPVDLYQNPDDRKRWSDKMLKYGYVNDEVLKQKKKDGSIVWCLETARVTHDKDGRVYLDGFIRDITKMKEIEERYHSIIDNIPDILYSLNAKGELILVNKAATDLLGYSKEELIGSHFSLVVLKDDLEKASKSFREIFEKKRNMTKDLKIRLKTKYGKIIRGELNARAVYDHKGRLLRTEGVIRDISGR